MNLIFIILCFSATNSYAMNQLHNPCSNSNDKVELLKRIEHRFKEKHNQQFSILYSRDSTAIESLFPQALVKGDQELIRLFALAGAPLNKDFDELGKKTPVAYASDLGNYELVSLLIQCGASANSGCPLYYAVQRSLPIVRLLKKYGADINAKKFGRTPLHIAVTRGNELITYLIKECGASPDIVSENKDDFGTPLHEATMKAGISAMGTLLMCGACVDAKNNKGETSLHVAVQHAKRDAVKLLLSWQANLCIRDYYGATPYTYIANKEIQEIIDEEIDKKRIDLQDLKMDWLQAAKRFLQLMHQALQLHVSNSI